MNHIHRIGLAVAAAMTSLTVMAAVAIQGYTSAPRPAQAAAAQQAAAETPTATEAATEAATLSPETIYVKPAPTPAIVKVTRTAPPAPPAIPAPTTRRRHHSDDGGGDR
jgi:hypothetical protein